MPPQRSGWRWTSTIVALSPGRLDVDREDVMDWGLFLSAIAIAGGSFVLGTMFGIEYQKVRVQRFWEQQRRRRRD